MVARALCDFKTSTIYMVKGHLTGCGQHGTALFAFLTGQSNIALFKMFKTYIYIYDVQGIN